MSTLSRPARGEGRMIAGVCGGLARQFGLSLPLVRFLFAIFGIFGVGEIVYIVLWIVMPKAR